jgi:small subunit ribosomal protein S3
VDYGFKEAFTMYGVIGVKVWVYHGDIMKKQEQAST